MYMIICYTIATINFKLIFNDVIYLISLYISTQNVVQIINLTLQRLISLSSTKAIGRGSYIFLVTIDATIFDA